MNRLSMYRLSLLGVGLLVAGVAIAIVVIAGAMSPGARSGGLTAQPNSQAQPVSQGQPRRDQLGPVAQPLTPAAGKFTLAGAPGYEITPVDGSAGAAAKAGQPAQQDVTCPGNNPCGP